MIPRHEALLGLHHTNRARTLYTGMTSDIVMRVRQHKMKVEPGSFTATYNVDTLVHAEEFTNVNDAIAQEKQIKGWRRAKKIALIESSNPAWEEVEVL